MSEPTVPPGPPPSSPPPPPAGGTPPTPPPSGPTPPPPSGPATPPPAAGPVSPNRSMMIVLSYLWLLALIPLLTEKEDREVQWHAKHGIVLMVAEILLGLVLTAATFAVDMLGFMGCATGCVSGVFWLLIVVLHVICIVKGVNGQRFIIPGVSQYADRF